ncbi:codanin-1 [Trichogramma pretiosum]|uniref:codanin-1 n=1 Tax=Trichogramma pretiosum TaxID=7493 RepID=UPI0006C9DF3E|nr:codanin-1 [Trichogramma pretiosum]
MAQELLTNILTFKILPADILKWLSSDDSDVDHSLEFNKYCQKDEFINYFLNYLQKQFTSILCNTNVHTKVLKKQVSKSDKEESCLSFENFSEMNTDYKYYDENSQTITKEENLSQEIQSEKLQNIANSKCLNKSPQTSTPNILKNNSAKKRIQPVKCSNSLKNVIDPAFKNSIEYEQIDKSIERKIHFDSPLHSARHSNQFLQSPMSALYNNSISSLSPINMSPNVYNKSYSDGSCQLSKASEKSLNNLSRNSKNSPRQNFNLSDFVVSDRGSNKKNKKKLNKSKNESQNSINQLASDLLSVQAEQNLKKKKVNPTRLETTDEKANKESPIFGIVSRPNIKNPQFLDVPTVEKCTDNESFKIERRLVKLERQKKPDEIASDASDVIVEENQSVLETLQNIHSKITNASVITVNKTLVENKHILNILAELYSGFLDFNLIINPMSELYLMMQLITANYTANVKQSGSNISTVYDVKEIKSLDSDNRNTKKNNSSFSRKCLQFEKCLSQSKNEFISFPEGIKSVESSDEKLESLNLDGLVTSLNNLNVQLDTKVNDSSLNESSMSHIQIIDTVDSDIKLFLDNPHNCVHFAIQVLHYQKPFLNSLDRVTLKLLYENKLISNFNPELHLFFKKIYYERVFESKQTKSSSFTCTADSNVCFQLETDNREKFPSTLAFQDFKKQRDLFYEILKIWEQNHLSPNWSFQLALKYKIKTLLSMHVDVANLTHFTRLFKSQMLISCIQSEQQADSLDHETLNFLKDIKDINQDKLSQLQKKLVTPLSQNGPVPLPSFPGAQEFFKNFILCASKPIFYMYLENILTHDIMELNDSNFTRSDIEELETAVDGTTKQNFLLCVATLRLLSKFLGYLHALPYNSKTAMVEDIMNTQISLRSKCLPRIGLQECLEYALVHGKLSLTVPWIVEYLAMMDPITIRLPYFKKVLETLYCIYRTTNQCSIAKNEDFMSHKTAILIKLVIGWLFELPTFPKELYCSWQFKYNNAILKAVHEKIQSSESNYNLVEDNDSIVSMKCSIFLDRLQLIDERILYLCCPFLKEFKILLTPGNSNVASLTSFRHVTPVSSKLQKKTEKFDVENLQVRLEEAFFHSQPASTQKTIEYVSERVASSCVKYIYNKLLPFERHKNNIVLKIIIEKNLDGSKLNSEIVKKILLEEKHLLFEQASSAVESLKKQISEVIPQMCKKKITQSIESLLPDDCVESIREIAAKIGTRISMERIDQWTQSYLINGSVFIKDMEATLEKMLTSNETSLDKIVQLNPAGENERKVHNQKDTGPAFIIDELREVILNILETRGLNLSMQVISTLCDQIYESLIEQADVTSSMKMIIQMLSVDLVLFLISYRNDLLSNEVQEKLFKIWKIHEFSHPEAPLNRLFSLRNIKLIAVARDTNTWLYFGKMLNALLRNNMITINTLSEQAVALLRMEWPIDVMKNLSKCIMEAIQNYHVCHEETEKIKKMLEWLAGAYNDMDKDGFN